MKKPIVKFEMKFIYAFADEKGRKEKVDSLYREFAEKIKKEILSAKLEVKYLSISEHKQK